MQPWVDATDISWNKPPMCFQGQSQTTANDALLDETNQFKDSISTVTVTYFHMEPACTLPSPAPPPKLHYSTFWRSVTRRIYQQNKQALKQMAQASGLLHTRIVD